MGCWVKGCCCVLKAGTCQQDKICFVGQDEWSTIVGRFSDSLDLATIYRVALRLELRLCRSASNQKHTNHGVSVRLTKVGSTGSRLACPVLNIRRSVAPAMACSRVPALGFLRALRRYSSPEAGLGGKHPRDIFSAQAVKVRRRFRSSLSATTGAGIAAILK